jgi:dipeptidyl aminopeptidase/acylaminoacyl peptidase
MRADRVRTPTLLTAGLNDRCTPPGQAMEFYRALRANGVDSALVLYPVEGHGVRKFPAAIDVATRMVAWFEQHCRAPCVLHGAELDQHWAAPRGTLGSR